MMSAKNGEGVKKDPIFADKQCIHFADNRGRGSKYPNKFVDVICGSTLSPLFVTWE